MEKSEPKLSDAQTEEQSNSMISYAPKKTPQTKTATALQLQKRLFAALLFGARAV